MARDFGVPAAIGWLVVVAGAAAQRAGWVALSLAAFVAWAAGDGAMVSTQTVLIGLVALIFATSTGADRDLLLRTQVVALYLFAALNKMNGSFLAGDAIARRTTDVPLVPAAIAAVVVEAWMAWAVWKRHRWALPVSIGLHAGIVAFMGTDLYEWTLLASYNGMVVALVWWVTQGNREPSPRMLAA